MLIDSLILLDIFKLGKSVLEAVAEMANQKLDKDHPRRKAADKADKASDDET